MQLKSRLIAVAILSIILAACGSVATPEPLSTDEAEVAQASTESSEQVTEPTSTPEPPTATPEPPTATPEPPTATSEPTEEVTEEAAQEDSLTALVSLIGDPARGEEIFNTLQDVGFACSTCHLANSEENLVGPGLLNIGQRAATRVEGESAAQYIFNSIMEPNSYIVEGYPENVMPQGYSEIFNEQDMYDLISYLLTLEG